jgi:hypothetical protein
MTRVGIKSSVQRDVVCNKDEQCQQWKNLCLAHEETIRKQTTELERLRSLLSQIVDDARSGLS